MILLYYIVLSFVKVKHKDKLIWGIFAWARETVADRVAGSLARRKAQARRAAESPDGAADDAENEAVAVVADGGKDGKTK